MPTFRFLFFFVRIAILFVSAFALGQPKVVPPKPQTARQALIEMITKGGDGIQKHLTVEVQDLLKSTGRPNPASLAMFNAFGGEKGLQGFESGEILFAYSDSAQHSRFEVHVDNDDLASDQDSLLLSLHTFRDGKEQESEELGFMSSHFTVSMKLEQGIWRLSKISVGAEFPIGDATFIEKTFLKTATGMATGLGAVALTPPASTTFHVSSGGETVPPPMAPESVVTLLAFAEGTFAQMHPDAGFTCSLSELREAYDVMGLDQQINTGSYDGYRLGLTGCAGKPAGSFQITAEPLMAKPGAKAFCTDATHNLRASDDGRGATCLSTGKLYQRPEDAPAAAGVDVHIHDPETPSKP